MNEGARPGLVRVFTQHIPLAQKRNWGSGRNCGPRSLHPASIFRPVEFLWPGTREQPIPSRSVSVLEDPRHDQQTFPKPHSLRHPDCFDPRRFVVGNASGARVRARGGGRNHRRTRQPRGAAPADDLPHGPGGESATGRGGLGRPGVRCAGAAAGLGHRGRAAAPGRVRPAFLCRFLPDRQRGLSRRRSGDRHRRRSPADATRRAALEPVAVRSAGGHRGPGLVASARPVLWAGPGPRCGAPGRCLRSGHRVFAVGAAGPATGRHATTA